eukprot:GHVL01014553.1.p1 GENE.GHVL01014553.1~~GHVL01014553.1.p1  ORF type:complete len:258 (+),score=69.90 GHVL01014553.1:107-880(+)
MLKYRLNEYINNENNISIHLIGDGKNNIIGESDMKKLFEYFEKYDSFRGCLDLSNNNISDISLIRLAKSLSKHTHLRELNISHNPITDSGAKILSETVIKLCDLTYLNMFKTKIDDIGIGYICQALRLYGNIENIHFPAVSCIGLKYVSDFVSASSRIRVLNISLKKDIYDETVKDMDNTTEMFLGDETEETKRKRMANETLTSCLKNFTSACLKANQLLDIKVENIPTKVKEELKKICLIHQENERKELFVVEQSK